MKQENNLITEIENIIHQYNNIFNTLNGYTELALEAKDENNEDEYSFFKEKLFITVGKKITIARELNERLNNIKSKIAQKLK